MCKKISQLLIFVFLVFSLPQAKAGEALESDFNTTNKLMYLCSGNYTQQESCFAYMMGFIHAMRVASAVSIVKFNHESTTSILTIENLINKKIHKNPNMGDSMTEAMMLYVLAEAGMIEFRRK